MKEYCTNITSISTNSLSAKLLDITENQVNEYLGLFRFNLWLQLSVKWKQALKATIFFLIPSTTLLSLNELLSWGQKVFTALNIKSRRKGGVLRALIRPPASPVRKSTRKTSLKEQRRVTPRRSHQTCPQFCVLSQQFGTVGRGWVFRFGGIFTELGARWYYFIFILDASHVKWESTFFFSPGGNEKGGNMIFWNWDVLQGAELI